MQKRFFSAAVKLRSCCPNFMYVTKGHRHEGYTEALGRDEKIDTAIAEFIAYWSLL